MFCFCFFFFFSRSSCFLKWDAQQDRVHANRKTVWVANDVCMSLMFDLNYIPWGQQQELRMSMGFLV